MFVQNMYGMNNGSTEQFTNYIIKLELNEYVWCLCVWCLCIMYVRSKVLPLCYRNSQGRTTLKPEEIAQLSHAYKIFRFIHPLLNILRLNDKVDILGSKHSMFLYNHIQTHTVIHKFLGSYYSLLYQDYQVYFQQSINIMQNIQ